MMPEDTEDLGEDEERLAALEKQMLENAERLESNTGTSDLAGPS